MQIIIDNKAVHDYVDVIFDADDENDFINNKKYTMFCKEWMEKAECSNDKCTFAHSVQQLRRKQCLRDQACNNKRCVFRHTHQSDEDFLSRNKLRQFTQKPHVKSAIVVIDESGSNSARKNNRYILETIEIARKCGRKAITFVFC